MKRLWIRTDEVKEAQDFILRVLAPEGLTGEIPVKILTGPQSVVPLGHIYDVSEDALFSLQEKYGERNVALTESGEVPESWISRSSPADALENTDGTLDRIADALENIAGTLDNISNVLDEFESCFAFDEFGCNVLQIGGNITSYER